MLTIAVCEDNPITSEEICQKIKQYSPMEAQIFSFSDDSDILAAVRERQFEPHIVFMDIELQGSSGIQTAKNITSLLPDCQIIYITNYVDYASQVYESSHIYFILKSQTDTYLPKALQKAIARLEELGRFYLAIQFGKTTARIPQKDILYMERVLRNTENPYERNHLQNAGKTERPERQYRKLVQFLPPPFSGQLPAYRHHEPADLHPV